MERSGVDEPTILILAGAGDPSCVWSTVSDGVNEEGVRCEVLEMPMKGVIVEPQPTSIEEYSRWVLTAIDRQDLSNVILAGHSLGALIALEVAASGSPRVSRLVVMCPADPMSVHPLLLSNAQEDPAEAASMIARWSYAPDARERLGATIEAHMAATSNLGAGVLATDLHACNNYRNGTNAASRITIPTTVVLSGDDHMTPRSAAISIIEALRDPVVHVFEGSGHAIEHERPVDVAAILVASATRGAAVDSITST